MAHNPTPVDAQLHLLRSVAKLANGRGKNDIEKARLALYQAIEQGKLDDARRWARALRAALEAHLAGHAMLGDALAAVGEIEAGPVAPPSTLPVAPAHRRAEIPAIAAELRRRFQFFAKDTADDATGRMIFAVLDELSALQRETASPIGDRLVDAERVILRVACALGPTVPSTGADGLEAEAQDALDAVNDYLRRHGLVMPYEKRT